MSTEPPGVDTEEVPEPNFDYQVSDAGTNEYKQYRRLQDINDARKAVQEARTQAREAILLGHDERAALATYRTRLEEYIFELRSIARKAGHAELLEGEKLGHVVFEPPPKLVQLHESKDVEVLTSPDRLEKRARYFHGLDSIIQAPSPLSETFEIVVKRKHQGRTTVSRTVQQEISFDVLDNARACLNDFAAMHGLDAEADNNRRKVSYGDPPASGDGEGGE